jgi:hypothetical protein
MWKGLSMGFYHDLIPAYPLHVPLKHKCNELIYLEAKPGGFVDPFGAQVGLQDLGNEH